VGAVRHFGAVIVMVGIGEELAFRGILLHSFLGEGASRGRVALAMLVSAVGFSLLHSINYFGGQSLPATVEQMGYTFLWGLMFAPLMLRLKSIVPLMIVHWLWDFVQFTIFLSGEMAIIKYDGLQYPIEPRHGPDPLLLVLATTASLARRRSVVARLVVPSGRALGRRPGPRLT
jgi:membrane protease YdiL (CAAX protease family)